MAYYHPTPKSFAYHPVRNGFVNLRTLRKLEDRPQLRSYGRRDDTECRTLVFDTPERASEWYLGAYGIKPVILEISGDVEIEDSGKLHLLEGMLFLTGEIPSEQVEYYEASSTPVLAGP